MRLGESYAPAPMFRPASPRTVLGMNPSLPTLQYGDDPTPEQFHQAIAEARRSGPIALGPYCAEVLGYDLVRTVLRDSRFVTPKGLALVVQGITAGPVWDRMTRLLHHLDGGEHRRLRALVARAFNPAAAERIRAACTDVITGLLQGVSGPCEFVADIADPYPVPIISSLLGAPRQDWAMISDWVTGIAKAQSLAVAENEALILRSWDALERYIQGLLDARAERPTDDLLSELLRAEADGDRLSHDELIALAVILFLGGTDTTRHQLAAAVQILAEHPDQWQALGQHPELVPAAVEEVLRHSPVNLRVLRQAVVDVDLGEVTVPGGSLVIANTAAANRDPAVYDHPARFDITRAGAPAMLTFGGGVHYCLGVHLARVELIEALRVVTARMAPPRRAGPAPWKPITELTGPIVLPLAFEPALIEQGGPGR